MRLTRLVSLFLSLVLVLAFWSGSSQATSAQEEIEALKAQVQMLLKRIDELEKKQAQTEKTVETKAPTNWRAYWKNGFRIEYKDPKSNREYKFRFRTGIQLRYTYLDRDNDIMNSNENYSSFTMRRLRFFVDGTAPNKNWKYFVHVQLEPRSKVNTHDAFVQWQKYPFFRVQFGRMKIPAMSVEYWQSGFMQNGTDRTIFTDDSEGYWPYDGGPRKPSTSESTFSGLGTPTLKVGGHLLANGFPVGGMLLYRSQGVNINGMVDYKDKKQFLTYWVGVYNGRDTQGDRNTRSDDMLYCFRVAVNWLPGSDPRGPLGPGTFKGYFMQGDYGYNTTPALATLFSGFWTKDRWKKVYDPTLFDGSDNIMRSVTHDIENYGFDFAVLFRYRGFSADVEAAWEEFIQDPNGAWEETWDRFGFRLNLGYFLVPRKWEVTAKYAYLERIMDNDLANSLGSGLGLVKLDNGKWGIEDNMQEFRVGVNYYWHGFNQYITADIAVLYRNIDDVSASEISKLGLTGISPDDFDDDTETDWRFRVMYQHFF